MADPLAKSALRWQLLPPGLAADAARQDQDDRWRSGERPSVEEYLAILPRVAASPEDAMLLIYGEFMSREALGETVNVAEYLRRFPAYAEQLAAVLAIHDGISGDLQSANLIEPASPIHPPTSPPEIPGYRDFTYVARGGMGLVYRATREDSGEPVAVKILAHILAGPEALVRFLQEAEILSCLQHSNIATFIASGKDRGQPYLVLEWIDGGTLGQRLSSTPLTIAETVGMLTIVAEAVAYAHDRGIVHRDLKPANILLTKEGMPKLTDFGVARWSGIGGTCTVTGQVLGTVRYMAPEQVQGKPTEIGPWTDIYGLGAILYECLTGRPPYGATDRLELIAHIVEHDPVSVEELNPLVPNEVLAIVAKCLARRPAERWPSARELARNLRRVQGTTSS